MLTRVAHYVKRSIFVPKVQPQNRLFAQKFEDIC